MNAHVDVPFEVVVTDGTPDSLDIITVEVYDPTDGTTIVAPTNASITQPRPGTYRTSLVVGVTGEFMIRWAIGDSAAEEPLTVNPVGISGDVDPALTPSVQDVADLLRARTSAGGTEVGTFNDATRPTASEVQTLIGQALSDLTTRVGLPVPLSYASDARRLVALQTATLIEASFFPNQLDTDRSAYRQYQAMYLAGVQSLVEAARRPGAMRLH